MHHCNSSGTAPLSPFSNDSQWEGQPTSPSLAEPENVTSERPILSGPIAAMLSMTLGILSNIVAFLILANAYARLRRRSKAFLLFASSLVATDFVGHVIPGSIVMRLYLSGGVPSEEYDRADPLCQFLGGSMVFFGLCPLFLGCAMAAERCLGVTKPLLHASLVTTTRTKLSLSVIWLAALCVALLPCFQLGSYTYQYPGTWCFIKVLEDTEKADVAFVMLFSGLGLTSLAAALVCNTISGLTLVLARIRKKPCNHRSARSHDIEMVVQLVGIMVTSCICWSPLLIVGLITVKQSYEGSIGDYLVTYKTLMIMGVRIASWNQILDPWVYILLRRSVLQKIYFITKRQTDFKESTFRCWEIHSFPSSEKNPVSRV
ncbi:prostaglandin E2 receptor EP1 subtype-like [Sinocyclocheilus rhinocerous]|uniref:Thromboxane A2 receptor n=1 Tax=Sinocyclocheilus rhinocerous TaxID=307959 RepID=A0A673IVM6_9TELE|nr:PREDICTED: prostaglandin E2 receptor EP1 subtype-like [Sinocyclocheilus rhinocerous]XP_016373993.1 PREDICTED: prostaglandin E2 receptor EP1 subtype-like [Sinocyclocheilus rhinocerous]XP_016373994.1 PREDICTED: prostaglandin E2 receptor EP1 subtype-like [Sinocyclocheilus rhinocerous]XP_016373995.1 PREDICTED: prostaglandin E2 receptor EP1 subtype-like [Sinocyclocheilus rhinocerous]